MKKIKFIIPVIAAICLFSSCYQDNKEDLYQHLQPQDCTIVDATYTAQIVPIINNHCFRCHNNTRQDGNVNLEGYAKVKPYIDDGSFLGSIEHTGGFAIMPPDGGKIPFCEIEEVRFWINNGALNN